VTASDHGFFIESLIVRGRGKLDAELSFSDGLNVVAGASDTGKSYALSCIDHAFGASKAPRPIPQASGYDTVIVRLLSRASGLAVEITRGLGGGDVRIRTFGSNGMVEEDLVVPARHDPNSQDTLSGFLLNLCGLYGKSLRKNKQGENRSLSFRDMAFLALVDEERIIAERPPHLSGHPVERTAESDAFRLLITGVESGKVITVPRKKAIESARAQLELVQQMMSQAVSNLERLGISELNVQQELEQIETARRTTLAEYENVRLGLTELERELADSIKQGREISSRLVVVDGLVRRFELLNRHYDSDVSRLKAIEEVGNVLESFPSRTCPLCGALPEEHREADADQKFRLEDVRAAAQKEMEKIDILRRDLVLLLNELGSERAQLEVRRDDSRSSAARLQARINEELRPRARATATALQAQTDTRDKVLQAKSLVEQLVELRRTAEILDRTTKLDRMGKAKVRVVPTSSEVDSFAKTVGDLLGEWRYPDLGRVVFSEMDQDLIIGGQPRTSHGKGVRALTCSAFITGLLRHCRTKHLPHPSFVVLDSPLVAYREPEAGDAESQRIRRAGVKEAFYQSLARGGSRGQVIVFENDDPPPDLSAANITIFTKSSSKWRYGFFPRSE
jgi:hypothetical protein